MVIRVNRQIIAKQTEPLTQLTSDCPCDNFYAMWCLVLLVLVLLLAIGSCFSHYRYWRRRGVEGPTPLPFYGNLFEYVMGRKHYGDVYGEIYRYVGLRLDVRRTRCCGLISISIYIALENTPPPSTLVCSKCRPRVCWFVT